MKIIPLIHSGDERRAITHTIRVDLTQRLDEMQSQLIGLRRRVDRLEEGVSPHPSG